MKLLLTGASGLIGGSVLHSLAQSAEIITLGRRPAPGAPAGASWIPCNLSAPLDTAILPEGIDTIVYLAQSEHFRDFPAKADDIFTINTLNPQRLLDWSQRHGVKRFIYASSGGVYGHGGSAFREDHPIQVQGPLGFYLASKRCAEQLAESYAGLLTVVIVRFFFVYGAGQRLGMLIPRLVRSVLDGAPITLQGDDGIRINPLFVADAGRALAACCRLNESTCINLAGPQALSLRDIGEEIGRQAGRRPVYAQAAGEPRHLVGDIGRMQGLLDGRLTSFTDGLVQYLASLPPDGPR